MIEGEILRAIGDYGIQTIMLLFFMFRTEKAIKNNTKALQEFNVVVANCKK